MMQSLKTFRVRQRFESPVLADVAGEVRAQLSGLELQRQVRPGQCVAITASSRGIANLVTILRTTAKHLKGLGAVPFLVPAMGSHGGGTATGQRQLLESYGVTEAAVGCPIRSEIEPALVCRTAEGFPVYCDRLALEADHILVCNRVKPHTRFVGPIESGLMKMLLIGLGKAAGAAEYHRLADEHGFSPLLESVTREIFAKCHILAGLAIIENSLEQTSRIEAIRPEAIASREKELLVLARRWMPRLPFDRVDLLVIDEIGKNISGTGLDTNVVGRKFTDHCGGDEEFPKVKWIAVRGLTAATHGNANGIGIAEFCRTQAIAAMDVRASRLNALSAGHPTAAMLPLDYASDREMLAAAIGCLAPADVSHVRLLWIRNTLRLEEVECSAAYLDEARWREDLVILTEPRPLLWDATGNLPLFEAAGK